MPSNITKTARCFAARGPDKVELQSCVTHNASQMHTLCHARCHCYQLLHERIHGTWRAIQPACHCRLCQILPICLCSRPVIRRHHKAECWQAFKCDQGNAEGLEALIKGLPALPDAVISNAALGTATVEKYEPDPHQQDLAMMQVTHSRLPF